jgi:hypothetical protein
MTEGEWNGCTDSFSMLRFLTGKGKASDRKLRLFACACARDLLAHNPDACHHPYREEKGAFESAVVRAEAAADGKGPPLPRYSITTFWVEHHSAERAAYVVFGVDPDIGLLIGEPAEAVKDFLVEPGLWLRDIFGLLPFHEVGIDPGWLAWQGGMVRKLAQAAYDERSLPGGTLDGNRLAVLADALEEAGCCDADLLGHLRGPGPHTRGCWPLDLILASTMRL